MVASKARTRRYVEGDRFSGPMGEGTVTKVKRGGMFPYEITWWNGRSEIYSPEQIDRYGYKYLPLTTEAEAVEEEVSGLFDGDFPREQGGGNIPLDFPRDQTQEVLQLIKEGMGDTAQLAFKTGLGMAAIAPVLRELQQAGQIERKQFLWVIRKCSDNSTCAAASASVSPSLDSSLENLPLLAYAKSTTTVETSSLSDIQVCPSLETSSDTTGGHSLESTSLPLPLPAPPSQSKASDSEPTMSATVSPPSSKRSPKSNRRTSRSKTSKACSVAPTDLEAKSDISADSSGTFPSAGTMSSGSWSAADILERPFLESGCSWLESPNGLSAVGRVPGQSRLEAQLKSEGHLQDGQCINPAFLEDAFEIPLGWCDRLVSRSAIALLEESGNPSEIALTPESERSLLSESSILTQSLKAEEELTPVDESAVGRHYWCDRLDVTVTVETVHNWRVTPRAKELTKAARCRPWWGNFPDVVVIQLDELVEVEELSCPVEIPVRPLTGISPNPIPDGDRPRSLEKFEFYVTVPAGIERPNLMPLDLCYLFPASSFWNRSRSAIKSFPRCPQYPAGAITAADSGGYVAATKWGGRYPYTPDQYVEWLSLWNPTWAATMDYCCEQPLTGGDRSKIRHRQKQTTRLAWLFWNKYRQSLWQWVPTIQGWDTEDYVWHAQQLKPLLEEMRSHYGESFRVGIGTLCARTSNAQIKDIVEAVSAELSAFKFHLWGVKQDAAPVVRGLPQVISSDSAAWDGLAGSRCRKVWEEEYRGKIPQAEYSWTIALPKYLKSLEKKLGVSVRHVSGDRPMSLEKTELTKQRGCLTQYAPSKKGVRYPKVEGRRDKFNDTHWYWNFGWKEKDEDSEERKSRSVSVKLCHLAEVRRAIADGKPYTYTLREILGKG